MAERSGLAPQWEGRRIQNQRSRRVSLEISVALTSLPSMSSPIAARVGKRWRQLPLRRLRNGTAAAKSGDAHASDPAVGGIARVRIGESILSCGKILAQRCYPAFDMAWRS